MRSKWEKVWKVSSYSILSIHTSYNEVTMRKGLKGFIVLHPLNNYFIQMEYDDTFHTFSHCDLTVWSNYWGDGVWWHLSYLYSLWPHCMKYLLMGWSTITTFTHFPIVTSLYEVFIKMQKVSSYSIPSIKTSVTEVTMSRGVKCVIVLHPLNKYVIQWGMEYDDTFHTFSHCDLNVWSIYWRDGVQWHLQPFFSFWPHCIKYLLNAVRSQWEKCERCHRTPFPQWILHTMKSQWEKVWKVSAYSIPSIKTS
jgi:hypothetical protein